MANASTKTQMSTIQLEISPISKLTAVCSSEVIINSIPWKVQASRSDDENSLAVYLQCAKQNDSSTWMVPARATIQLIPFSEEKNEHVHHITPWAFCQSCRLFGTPSFIKWDELLNAENKYVQDDTIQLKIEITAEDPNYVHRSILKFEHVDKSCDCGSLAVFRLTVTNVKNLMAVTSPQFIVRGLPWGLSVYKSPASSLGIMLDSKETHKKVTCKMTMSVKLLSSKDDEQPIEKSNTGTLQMLENLKIMPILSWAEMLKPEKGYVDNDSITLEVEIKADKRKGDAPDLDPNQLAKRPRFECSICLNDIGSQDISATPCCHLFCTACITEAVRKHGVCPMCNGAVQLNDLRRMYLSAAK